MNTDKKYNGWTNWETWNCNLHFDDNFSEQAQECFDAAEADKTFSKKENAALALKDIIEADINDYIDQIGEIQNPFIQDMVNGYLSEVNYYQIAQAYISDMEEETEAA